MKTIRHWLAHRLGWNVGKIVIWRAVCGKEMVGFLCSGCGKFEGIRPVQIGRKLVPFVCLLFTGCVVREKVRVEYKTLPPQERVFFIVPDTTEEKKPSKVEQNKEAQSWA